MGTRVAALASLVLAALWSGATLFFTVVVTRSAFRVLPTRALAGTLVGDALPALFMGGLATGAVLIALALPAAAPARATRIALGVIALAGCGVGQFVINPRLHRLREQLAGPVDALAAGDPLRIEFGRLHVASIGTLGLALVAMVAVTLALAWSLTREVP
ncbi:MAG: DUF4149 domain-containing protein [Gemmatimonadaceae bacterium]